MDIIFNSKDWSGKWNFKRSDASRLFLKILEWYEVFESKIINDRNIIIGKVCVQKVDGAPFSDCLTITIHGKVYGEDAVEKVQFSLKEIFSQNNKNHLAERLTKRFTERLERIKVSVNERNSTIEETMKKLKTD